MEPLEHTRLKIQAIMRLPFYEGGMISKKSKSVTQQGFQIYSAIPNYLSLIGDQDYFSAADS